MPRRKQKARRSRGTGSYSFRDGRHIVQWMAQGKRCTKSFQTAAEANEALERLESGKSSGTMAAHAELWLAGRQAMSSGYDDRNRWTNHWLPLIGEMTPDQITVMVMKNAIRVFSKTLSKTTVKLLFSLLSSLFNELVEAGDAEHNPVRDLSRATRRMYLRPDHDPKTVPYLRSEADIARVYQTLLSKNTSVAVAFAIGSCAGLRTGEVRALEWGHVDLARRLIHVQVQPERRRGMPAHLLSEDGRSTLKDDDSRFVPISDSLAAVLEAQSVRTGGVGLVCPPSFGLRGEAAAGPRRRFLGEHMMGETLAEALEELGLAKDGLNWYGATRHSHASLFVLNGGKLEVLQRMMGHSTILTTQRYVHLCPETYTDQDRGRVQVAFAA